MYLRVYKVIKSSNLPSTSTLKFVSPALLVQLLIYNSVSIFSLACYFPLHHQNNKKESIDLRLCIAFIEKLRGISYIYEVMYIRDSCNFWPRQESTSGAPHVRSLRYAPYQIFFSDTLYQSH